MDKENYDKIDFHHQMYIALIYLKKNKENYNSGLN